MFEGPTFPLSKNSLNKYFYCFPSRQLHPNIRRNFCISLNNDPLKMCFFQNIIVFMIGGGGRGGIIRSRLNCVNSPLTLHAARVLQLCASFAPG